MSPRISYKWIICHEYEISYAFCLNYFHDLCTWNSFHDLCTRNYFHDLCTGIFSHDLCIGNYFHPLSTWNYFLDMCTENCFHDLCTGNFSIICVPKITSMTCVQEIRYILLKWLIYFNKYLNEKFVILIQFNTVILILKYDLLFVFEKTHVCC